MSFKTNALLTVVAAAALYSGYWYSSVLESDEKSAAQSKEQELAAARAKYSPIQGTILPTARKIAVPALVKDNAQTFTLDDLTGHWSLLFFGYANCPDICPTTMGVAAQAKKNAEGNNHIFPQVIFVSVDPERDEIGMLGEYVRYFDKDFIGVTGDANLIKALTLQMSVVYMKMAPEEGASGSRRCEPPAGDGGHGASEIRQGRGGVCARHDGSR